MSANVESMFYYGKDEEGNRFVPWHGLGTCVEEALNSEEALKAAEDTGAEEMFVIGGGSVYRQFIDRADRLYITLIDADIEGDTTFPEYDTRDYKIIASEHFSADEKNACDMDFITYEKIKK